jgi:transcriptional regulator with XRE-family HTH domain
MASEAERLRRTVGARVRELRRIRGRLSQERLAFQAGFDPSFIGRLERGDTGVTVETVAAICGALGITLREFFQPFDRPSGLRGPRRRRRATP